MDSFVRNLFAPPARNYNPTAGVHDLNWFSVHRPELFSFVKSVANKWNDHALISAPCKSGKREMIETFSLFLGEPHYCHVLLTNFDRRDCKEQRVELQSAPYNIRTFYGKELRSAVDYIRPQLANRKTVCVHVDENDYGSGDTQRFVTTFDVLRQVHNLDNLRIFFYSATGEELLYSEFMGECRQWPFTPPRSFYGPKHYLDDGKVCDATPFWDCIIEDFTPQGREIMKAWKRSRKHFGIVRFATRQTDADRSVPQYALMSNDSEFRKQLREYGVTPFFIDKDNSFTWGGHSDDIPQQHSWQYLKRMKDKVLLVVNQTFSRSTEMRFHADVQFIHDYRKASTPFSTYNQALGRANHYNSTETPYIYACVQTMRLAATDITPEDYCNRTGRQISSRVRNQKQGSAYRVEIVKGDKLISLPATGYTIMTISTQGIRGAKHPNDCAAALLTGAKRHNKRIFNVDGPCKFYPESWEKLVRLHPEWVGQYVIVVESGDNPQKVPKTIRSMYNT